MSAPPDWTGRRACQILLRAEADGVTKSEGSTGSKESRAVRRQRVGQSQLLESCGEDVEGAGDLAPKAGGDRRGRVLTDQPLNNVPGAVRADEGAVVDELVVK